MKYYILFTAFFVSFLNINAQETVDFTISFTDIPEKYVGKEIYIGIWSDSKDKFLEEGTADMGKKVKVSGTTTNFTFPLPKGKSYAFSGFIDYDGSGKINKNFLGIPKEPYCFSNNYKPTMSAPDFEDCVFTMDSDKTMKIKFIY